VNDCDIYAIIVTRFQRDLKSCKKLHLEPVAALCIVVAETDNLHAAAMFAGAEAVDADDNDIAVLVLSSDVAFNGYVSPVCVPDTNCKDGTACIATGWGNTMGE
jgi:Trypsin